MISLYHLHIEPTTQCNARCPQCPRTDVSKGDTRSDLPIVEWDVDYLRDVLAAPQFSNVNDILINGNYGDIVMHSSPLEFARVCRDKADRVQFNTNGSGLKTDFWHELGKMGVTVEFSIEGMSQETHEQYRRNTNFNRIIENAKAFIHAGGYAKWAMTLFRHNQHEVDDCEEFAYYLGFKEFNPRKDPARFIGGAITPYNWRGKQYEIYAPEMYTRADAFDTPSCYIRRGKHQVSLYLSADQKMFPCCYSDDIFSKDRFSLPINLSSLDSQLEMVYNEYVRTQFSSNPKVVCRNVCQIKGIK